MSRLAIAIALGTAAMLSLTACGAGAAPSGSNPSASAPPAGGPVTTEADALARVIAHEPRFTGIRPRDPDMIGQSSWYEIAPASGVGAFLVSIRVGWGDCQAGCIDEHTWVYAVGPDGTVTLQSEGGDEVPPAAFPSPDAGGAAGTGIHVIAVAGPTCPVETVPPDPACAAKPVPNVTVLVMDAGGALHEKIVLDAAGQRFLELQPGAYVVNAEGVAGYMNGPEAQRITVADGRITEVTLAFDTGIR